MFIFNLRCSSHLYILCTVERCLVELQVLGVKVDSNKRPSESKLSLTVHSLIIADALQSYGPDYELLVASHRNVRCVLLQPLATLDYSFMDSLHGSKSMNMHGRLFDCGTEQNNL